MKKYLKILLLFISSIALAQQAEKQIISGTVSYLSSQNVYVTFENTKGIETGDTLFTKVKDNYKPVIIVNHKSSKSCAGLNIDGSSLKIDGKVYAFIDKQEEEIVEEVQAQDSLVIPMIVTTDPVKNNIVKEPAVNVPKLSGKVSLQSYSNITNDGSHFDYQRWRYTFRLSAEHISGSGLSYTHYLNFAYKASDWNNISSNLGRALRIYDLALNYDFSESSSLWAGRHINNKISNISSVDGIQFQQTFSEWSFGIVAGARPDFLHNMGFNMKLFEYGAYVSREDILQKGMMENTFSYFVQTNDFKTDRRFIYFQHSNSLIENTRLFLSTEIDLYKKIMGVSESDFSLTSLFISANIRPSSIFSVNLSYDARKNVVYYETFQSTIDSLFENETRQGFRFRTTVKPLDYVYLGLNYGYRFRSGDIKPSSNYGGYITYAKIPGIEANTSVSISKLKSSYFNGTLWSVQLSKSLTDEIELALGYRNTKYKFDKAIEDLLEHSASLSISTWVFNPVYLNLSYEGVFEDVRTSGRALVSLSYRF